MSAFLYVGLGGFVGSILRYGVGLLITGFGLFSFPWATLIVNSAGGFAIGFLSQQKWVTADLKLLLMVGVLGGFTTFSAFGLETLLLLQEQRLTSALVNVLLNVSLCLIATTLGIWVSKAG
jgi:CrcB protein